jgi:hypothetical protein
LKIGRYLLGGRSLIHDLRLIDVNRRGVFLTFPEGAGLTEDEIFFIVRPLTRQRDAVLNPGQPRKIVAEVEVLQVLDRTRARVRVLRGSVIKGIGAERASGHTGHSQSEGSHS